MKTGRWCWFGHGEKKDENYLMEYVKHFEMEGRVPAGRPKMTENEVLRKDLKNKTWQTGCIHLCGLANNHQVTKVDHVNTEPAFQNDDETDNNNNVSNYLFPIIIFHSAFHKCDWNERLSHVGYHSHHLSIEGKAEGHLVATAQRQLEHIEPEDCPKGSSLKVKQQ